MSIPPRQIFTIRHAEKPADDAANSEPPFGIDINGNPNPHSLTPRGWQRSGALTDLFDPQRGSVDIASDFGGVRIVPGDLEASVLFTKVKGEPLPSNLGRPMPLHFERLTPQEIQILRDWISEGAKDN